MLSMQMGKESMQNRKPMILVLAGPNGSGKSTITTFFDKVGKYTNADDVVATTGMDNMETPKRIIRKHKDELSIYPNEYWSEQDIIELISNVPRPTGKQKHLLL